MFKSLFYGMTRKLWVKIMVPVAAIVVLVVVGSLWYNLTFQRQMAMGQLENQNQTLANAVEGGMFDALAVGDNDTVRLQFRRLREKTRGLKVFVYDFNGRVSFATEEAIVGANTETILDPDTNGQLREILDSGTAVHNSSRVVLDGEAYVIENTTIMNEERCHHCHGNKRAVLGGISVFSSMQSVQDRIRSGRTTSILIGLAGLCLIILVIWTFFHFMVNRRVKRIMAATSRMQKKDFTQTFSLGEGDELNHILARIDLVTAELGQTIREILENSQTITQSAGQLSGIAETLNEHSVKASEMTGSVSAASEEMSTGNQSIAAAMEQSADALNTIAAAVDQMSATAGEVAKNAASSREMTEQVALAFKEILEAVGELGERANDVDEVTDEIRAIAEQVSMLALNAKIEAARAGEAGKGFAVVANEITELADDTNRSTIEADVKLRWIKDTSRNLIERVSGLSARVGDTDQAIAGIAASVEEQNATTREIAENINEVSDNISRVNQSITQGAQVAGEIAKDISEVEYGAGQVQDESAKVNDNAARLSDMAEKLTRLMASFKV